MHITAHRRIDAHRIPSRALKGIRPQDIQNAFDKSLVRTSNSRKIT